MKKPSVATTENLIAELAAIKRLFVFALLRSGQNRTKWRWPSASTRARSAVCFRPS